jgi:AraC-like DNA-binding protein
MVTESSATFGSRILVAASWGVGELVETLGGCQWRVLQRASVKPSEIADPLADISVRQHCDLFEEAAHSTGAADFGMQFGRALRPTMLGPIGYLISNAPTLRAALTTLCTYHPAHMSGALLSLTAREGTAILGYRICDREVLETRQETEMTLAAFCSFLRYTLGAAWAPEFVCFTHSKLHSRYEGMNACFDRPSNCIVFPATQLDTPMPSPDLYMATMMRSLLEQRLKTAPPVGFVECVRERIELSLNEGLTTIESIAAKIGMRESRLAAKLTEAGTSFSELLRDARRTLALRYLKDETMPLTDIALYLGYSELSAFSRAFHKWAGMSPQAFRQRSAGNHGEQRDSAP